MGAALARRGLTLEHADFVVDGLLTASLRGVDTHGVRLFPVYLAELDGGRSRARPEIRWQGGATAFRVMDAGHALGLVAGRVACREAVRLAKAHGIAGVAVRSSNHFGAASVYTLEMARADVVGFAFTNGDALVAPHGGAEPLVGTNPISAAARGAEGDLFCVDMATSQVSYSKVKSHRERGLPLEPGWAVTSDGGDAALDSSRSEVSALKPLGGGASHKGQCLGMLVEVLCALLGGMPFDHELSHLYAEPYDEPRQVAHLFLAIDVAAAEDPEVFRARLSRLLDHTRAQEAAAGERVVAPGDPEQAAERERLRRGIPLSADEAAFFARIEAES
jgi:LDH2 family malate/lactate/ureidoglycolate dehydrogenase